MGKLVGLLAVIAVAVWMCNRLNSGGPGVAPPVVVTPGPVFQADIEAICRRRNVTIVSYGEAGNIVDFTVKGRDRNAVSDILDDLGPEGIGIMKDLINYADPNRYWIEIEEGGQAHYARHQIRAMR